MNEDALKLKLEFERTRAVYLNQLVNRLFFLLTVETFGLVFTITLIIKRFF